MVTNLAYFYESSKKVRGGKFVWVKDSNGEQRGNVLLGGTIKNPSKGFGYLWAAQLMQYTPSQPIIIFRSFEVQAKVLADLRLHDMEFKILQEKINECKQKNFLTGVTSTLEWNPIIRYYY